MNYKHFSFVTQRLDRVSQRRPDRLVAHRQRSKQKGRQARY